GSAKRGNGKDHQSEHKHGLAMTLVPQASRRDKCDPKSQYVAGDYQSCLCWCGVKRFFKRGQYDIDLDHIKDGYHSYTRCYTQSDPSRHNTSAVVEKSATW